MNDPQWTDQHVPRGGHGKYDMLGMEPRLESAVTRVLRGPREQLVRHDRAAVLVILKNERVAGPRCQCRKPR